MASSAAPIDPRLLRRGRATIGFLAATVVVGVSQAILLIGQAWLLATIISTLWARHGITQTVANQLLQLSLLFLVRGALAWLVSWLGHRASAQVKSQLRQDILAARLNAPYGTSDAPAISQGRLMTLVGQGLDALDGWYSRYLPQLVLAMVVPVLLIGVVALTDLTSAVIMIITLPLIPFFMILVGLTTKHHLNKRWRAQAVLGHHFADLIGGLTTLQLFGRARGQIRGLTQAEDQHRGETTKTLRVAFLSALIMEILGTLSVALVAVGIGLRVVDGQMALLPGLLVLILAPEVYLPLRQVGVHYHDAADGRAAAAEALDLIEAAETPPCDASEADPVLVASIEVDQAATAFTPAVSATLRTGEITVLTGPSGCGKTTMINLIMGWQEPTSGSIRYLDEQHSELALTGSQWRSAVAWVPQEPGFLPSSVADNLRLGNPLADTVELREALDRCGGSEISLTAHMGDEGHGLSVGQRRRVALARALLRVQERSHGWLVIDEPTAGLDADAEERFLAELPTDVGIVIISHRDAVIARADQVITLAAPARASVESQPSTGANDTSSTHVVAPSSDPSSDPSSEVTPAVTFPFWWRWLRSFSPSARLVGAVLLGVAAAASGVGLLATAAWLLSRAAEQPPVLHLMVAVVAVRFFGLGKGVFRYAERLLGHDVALRHQSTLRIGTYARLADRLLPTRGRADLVHRLTQDTAAAVDVVVRLRLPAIVVAIVAIAVVIATALVSPWAAAAAAVCYLIAGAVAPWLGERVTRRQLQGLAAVRGELATEVSLTHRMAAELSAYDQHQPQLARAAAADRRLRHIEQRAALATGLTNGLTLIALGLGCVASVWIAGLAVAPSGVDGSAQVGTVAAVMVAVLALVPLAMLDVVAPMGLAAQTARAARSALARVATVGTTEPLLVDRDRLKLSPTNPTASTHPTEFALDLDQVRIGWGEAPLPVPALTLQLRRGERLTITGPSGIGKTTLALTVAGLLAPHAGTVRVQHTVAMLSQDAHIFDTTVRENLRLARPDAADDELRHALTLVGLDWSLDRAVGEHGSSISGGEARRLAMARLFLRSPDVVIVDEPTEQLDRATAADLLDTVDQLWPATTGVSMLIISHHPEFVRAHLGGELLELGNHHDRGAPAPV